jgi:flavin reductase (DIM6/NTAB) family NADH-FMN oxidoreductase RutF
VPNFFDPATDALAFRHALGAFGTGVTVVTVATPEGPVGITANSFASVSLDPPLVLWSPAKSSRRFNMFHGAPHFAIHVLGADQRDIAAGFTRPSDGFDGLDWARSTEGTPLIEGCLARFECALHAAHDGGDHEIIVGRVLRVSTGDGAPLIFQGGRYGGFNDGL